MSKPKIVAENTEQRYEDSAPAASTMGRIVFGFGSLGLSELLRQPQYVTTLLLDTGKEIEGEGETEYESKKAAYENYNYEYGEEDSGNE